MKLFVKFLTGDFCFHWDLARLKKRLKSFPMSGSSNDKCLCLTSSDTLLSMAPSIECSAPGEKTHRGLRHLQTLLKFWNNIITFKGLYWGEILPQSRLFAAQQSKMFVWSSSDTDHEQDCLNRWVQWCADSALFESTHRGCRGCRPARSWCHRGWPSCQRKSQSCTHTHIHTQRVHSKIIRGLTQFCQQFISVYVCLPGDGHSSLLARSHGNAALEVMQLAKVLPQRAAALEIPRHIYRTLRHTHTHKRS